MSTKYYAGRPLRSGSNTYYVGDVVPDAGQIRNLHNLLATGHVYRVVDEGDFDQLPPHVRKEAIARRDGHSAPSNIITTDSGESARESFDNDPAVKRSRAQAALSQAYAAKETVKGKVQRDDKHIRRAAKIFGKSVLDESAAVKPKEEPDPIPEEEPQAGLEEPQEEPAAPQEPQKEEVVAEEPDAPQEEPEKKPAAAKKAPAKKAPAKK